MSQVRCLKRARTSRLLHVGELQLLLLNRAGEVLDRPLALRRARPQRALEGEALIQDHARPLSSGQKRRRAARAACARSQPRGPSARADGRLDEGRPLLELGGRKPRADGVLAIELLLFNIIRRFLILLFER